MFTMTPPVACCIICRPAHLQPRNAPVRLMPTTVFQPFTEISSGLARKEAPALFTITSSWPHSWTARSTIAFIWSSWRTSRAMANDRLPTSRTALTTGSRCSSLREQRATSAPARANSIAMDLPMPVPPPVTIAVLPSSEKGDLAMARTIPQGSPPVHCSEMGQNGTGNKSPRPRISLCEMSSREPGSPDRIRRFEADVLVHLDDLYRAALRLTGNAAEAQDLTQDTCLRAFERLDQLRSPAAARVWVFTILRSIFLRRIERQSRTVDVQIIDSPLLEAGAVLHDTYEALRPIQETPLGEVREALRRLPLPYREP